MASTKLARFLDLSRRHPNKMGALVSLPIIPLMLLLMVHHGLIAFAWIGLYMFFGGLWLFCSRPICKMISTALLLATVAPLFILGIVRM